MTKRFIVFAGDSYYPVGGTDDFYGSFATEGEAKLALVAAAKRSDWTHFLDTETDRVTSYWSDTEKFQTEPLRAAR